MSRMGVSGVFGDYAEHDPIDNVDEAEKVVNELNEVAATDAKQTAEAYMLTVQQLGNIAGEYARRIRLLTWGLVAAVIYLVLKEV